MIQCFYYPHFIIRDGSSAPTKGILITVSSKLCGYNQ